MVRRHPDRARIGSEVVQPDRTGVADQDAEDATTARQGADRRALRLVDAVRDELLELRPLRIEDTERRIARIGQLGGGRHETREQGLEIELRAQRDAGLDQRALTTSGIFHCTILPRSDAHRSA